MANNRKTHYSKALMERGCSANIEDFLAHFNGELKLQTFHNWTSTKPTILSVMVKEFLRENKKYKVKVAE